MAWDDDDDELGDDEDHASGASRLAHWIEEQYDGDERIQPAELLEPGPLEGEAIRVRLPLNEETYFFVSVLEDDLLVRVGLATEDKELSEELEEAATERSGSLTEFLQAALGTDDELEFEVQHFHDDVYYFASEIPFQREVDLNARIIREPLSLYLEGYINAILGLLVENDGEDEDEE